MNMRRVDGVVVVIGGLGATRGEDWSKGGLWAKGLLLGISLNLPPSPVKKIW